MNSRATSVAVCVGVALVIFGAVCVATGSPDEAAVDLLFGWFLFLRDVLPRVRPDTLAIAVGIVAAILLFLGAHVLLRWWSRATVAEGETRGPWKFSWTFAVVTLLLTGFAAGVALIGAAHQAVWMISSPKKATKGVAADRDPRKNNLKFLGVGIYSFDDAEARPLKSHNTLRTSDGWSKAEHGWLTAIAIYCGHALDSLDRDKPWDDPANKFQFEHIFPEVIHRDYGAGAWYDKDGYVVSHYAANLNLFGAETEGFRGNTSVGNAETILLGQVAEKFEPWGKPGNARDPALGIGKSPDGFGGMPEEKGAWFVMVDGSVRYINKDIDPAVMKALGSRKTKAADSTKQNNKDTQ